MQVRSVSFDTSFLIKNDSLIDKVIKILTRDNIPCFITSTVASEIEQLKVWGRITISEYKKTIKRWKDTHATVIDFRNRLLSDAFGKACIKSMEKHHGVKVDDIANDCYILVSTFLVIWEYHQSSHQQKGSLSFREGNLSQLSFLIYPL